MNLENKKVLIIAPSFFGYSKHIANYIKQRGAVVELIDSEPSSVFATVLAALKYKKSRFFRSALSSYENSKFNEISGDNFNLFIVINGQYITSQLIKRIQNNLLAKDSKSILYYWDSIDVLDDDQSRVSLFDNVATFDNVDYERNSKTFKFLPLFYIDSYGDKREEHCYKYDVCTVGSYKYNRYMMIQEIKKQNPEISFFTYQYCKLLTILPHKLLRPKYKNIHWKELQTKKISSEEINEIYRQSHAILDVPMKGQNGLTMRTFECLGAHKKIITTNENVMKYDFYDPAYIYVMSDDCQLPNKAWFENESIHWNDEIIENYSIQNWVNKLLLV